MYIEKENITALRPQRAYLWLSVYWKRKSITVLRPQSTYGYKSDRKAPKCRSPR